MERTMKKTGIVIAVSSIMLMAINIYARSGYSLQQCKELALENNVLTKNASLDVSAAKQVKKSAFTNYLPKVNANATAFRMKDPLVDTKISGADLPVYNGNPSNLRTATEYAYFPGMPVTGLEKGVISSVTLTQPIFAGGRIVNGNKLAQIGTDVKEKQRTLAECEVLIVVEEKYRRIKTLQDKVKTLDDYKTMLDTLAKEANDAYMAGLINKNDILKISIKQTEIAINQIKLQSGIKLAEMDLCQYIGIPYDSSWALIDKNQGILTPDKLRIDHSDALQNRAEYALLQKGVEVQRLQTKMKIGGYLPEIGAGVGGMYLKYLIGDETSDAFVFASVKIPVSGLWEAVPVIREHKLKEKIALNSSNDNAERLSLQMQNAWDELDNQYKQIGLAENAIKQAEENLKINNDNYNAGLINISDMLEAQALYQQTKDTMSDAVANYQVKVSAYLQVTGRYELLYK